MPQWDLLLLDAHLATMRDGAPFGAIASGALGCKDGRIVFADAIDRLPGKPAELAARVESVGGKLVTPGLVDCHTHLVFAGNRAEEFEMRRTGKTYEEIARAGGGIVSTMCKTREASESELLAQSLPRARALRDDGVTTVEIK